MSASAGYAATVKISGTPTAFTGEATSLVSTGVYQVTNATKRILDPATAIVVKDGGTPVSAAAYTVDYLFGKISGYTPSGALTVDGGYLPLLSIVLARKYSIDCMRVLLDSTNYDSSGVEHFTPSIKSAEGEIETLEVGDTDLDAGAGSVVLATLYDGGTRKLIEVQPGGAGKYFRAWVGFSAWGASGAVADLEAAVLKWKTDRIAASGRSETISFGWGT